MIRCELEFRKNGENAVVHPSTKKIITEDICSRLSHLQEEMNLYPEGLIQARYENAELILHISGYPAWLSRKMEEAIRFPEHPPWDSDQTAPGH